MTGGPGTPPAVDVARLMDEIKDRVRERKASGFYSEEEVRRIVQMELELPNKRAALRYRRRPTSIRSA